MQEDGEDLYVYSEESNVSEDELPALEPKQHSIDLNQPRVLVMKGVYERTEYSSSWIGIWGMGYDGTILGETCDFHYSLKSGAETADPDPISGDYSGYFVVKTDVQKRVYERNLSLDFTKENDVFKVTGKGENEYGEFTLEGLYNPSTKDLTCTKEYMKRSNPVRRRNLPRTKPKPKSTPTSTPKTNPPTKNKPKVKKEPTTRKSSLRACAAILQRVMNHTDATPFLDPIDTVPHTLPDPQQPTDLRTIDRRLQAGELQSREEFVRLVRQVFNNVLLHRPPNDAIAMQAKRLSDFFEGEIAAGAGKKGTPTQRPEVVKKRCRAFTAMQQGMKRWNSEDAIVNAYMEKRGRGMHQLMEWLNQNGFEGMDVKRENGPLSFGEVSRLRNQLARLHGDQLARIVRLALPSFEANEKKQVTLKLSALSADTLRLLQFEVQRVMEEEYAQKLAKEETKKKQKSEE